jgi:hydroxyacylglutathione hydrolase
MFNIFPVKAFSDNYIWTMVQGKTAVVVDPGDASPVIEFLENNELCLEAIIITHHHFDHSGGIEELTSKYNCPAYGPAGGHINGITKPLTDNEPFEVMGTTFEALATPGHTNDQLAYYSNDAGDPILFCGDTLFAGGCGRLFEGTPLQMQTSLNRFSSLPTNTKVYCGHEYTESNLVFALAVEPANKDILQRLEEVKILRNENKVTLPSLIELELKTNPFMRTNIESVKSSAEKYTGEILKSNSDVLGAIRSWKDNF